MTTLTAPDTKGKRYFLQMWRPDTARAAVGKKIQYTASNQFRPTKPTKGDIVWICTVLDGELFLVGKVCVDEVCSEGRAHALLGAEIWPAKHYAIANPKVESRAKLVALGRGASALRFVSPTAQRLNVVEGKISGGQLQTLRELDTSSAEFLEHIIADQLDRSVASNASCS